MIQASQFAESPIVLKEHRRYNPEHKQLKGRAVNADKNAQVTIKELDKANILSVQDLKAGLAIRTFSHVGTIKVGDIALTIRPKIDGDQLLNLMQYALRLRPLKEYRPKTAISTAHHGFLDLLIKELIDQVSELISRGLHRAYTLTESELPTPRGRIDFCRIARQGGITKARLPCKYYPRSSDCLINQVLLAGLRLATGITFDFTLFGHLQHVIAQLENDVSHIELNRHVLRKLGSKVNRLVSAYESSLRIIQILYERQGASLVGQPSVRLRGFLFDMNIFFEALIERFLRENLTSAQVYYHDPMSQMLAYEPSCKNDKRRPITLRPDFILRKKGKIVGILDTKYRDLDAKCDNSKTKLPREMLYQLGMYALSQPAGMSATILYPTTCQKACEQVITIDSPFRRPAASGHTACIKLRPVDLNRLQEVIQRSRNGGRTPEKIQFANKLAFGAQSQ